MKKFLWLAVLLLLAIPTLASAGQTMPKARVAELIKHVEDGVDEFRDYLERRGDDARDRSKDSDDSRRNKGGTSEARKDRAEGGKDELDDALGDLNRSTNRLRRKFDATDTWMETKHEVEEVVEDARKINQHVTRGKYGTEVGRIWGALRTRINELARAYNVAPLG